MQRITRLPLLLGAVLSRLEKQDEEYESCKTAFEVLNKVIKKIWSRNKTIQQDFNVADS